LRDIVVAERRSAGERPIPNLKVLRLRSRDLRGPILVPVDNLLAGSRSWGGSRNRWALSDDCTGIRKDECFGLKTSHVQPVPIHRSGAHEQHVRAERSQLLLGFRGSPFSNTDNGNYRANSDDQTEHSQARAHFVASQRAQCKHEC
jgi:hypothetical protein